MKLRAYSRSDLDQLYSLDQLCFPPEIAYSRGELEYFLQRKHSIVTVAEQGDGTIAGFSITELTRSEDGISGHVITIDVRPELRRNGIATLLMQELKAQSLRAGASSLVLEVAEGNVSALEFYRREKFHVTGRIEGYYGGTGSALTMALKLESEPAR